MKYTGEKFIEKAIEVHGDKYDYSLVEYIKSDKKVKIICKEHEIFEQTPRDHLTGRGCSYCGKLNRAKKQTFTQEQFIEKAIKVHGENFDYSQVEYVNSQTHIKLKCNICGYEFSQVPNSHLQGYGCDKCAHKVNHENQRLTEREIIERAIKVHGEEKFDYSNMNYKRSHEPINIICKICDNNFKQLISNHINQKQGCPFCSGRYMDTEIFVKKAKEVHGNEYNYKEVNYEKSSIDIKIICNKTNQPFYQTPNNHLSGNKCPCCSNKRYSLKAVKYLDFISQYHGIKIKHQLNGGEYTIQNTRYRADGYCVETNTIYEFHGTIYHGDPRFCHPSEFNYLGRNYGELYNSTIEREKQIKDMGFNLVVMWESDWNKINKCVKFIQKKFRNSKIGFSFRQKPSGL
jgi:hypothetical protein